MINDLVTEYAKPAISALIFLFIIIKLIMIKMYGFKDNRAHLFIISMNLFSRPVIENTYSEELQGYYRMSNKVNLAFYATTILILILYVLFRFYL